MRRASFAALGLIIAAAFLPASVFAAGNVLVPTDNSDGSSSYSNLGIGAAPPSAVPPPQSAPSTLPPATAAASSPKPAPATASPASPAPFGSLPSTPAPTNTAPLIDPPSTAKILPGQAPTQVMHVPDMSAIMAQAYKNMPYRMTVGIDGKSVFGTKDVETLHAKLGLTREQIPSSCILTVRGMIQTSKGTYLISGPASPQATVSYDGTISNLMVAGMALCSVAQLPAGLGLIVETGDRYQVPLQTINCPAPTRQVSQLDITYNGTATAQCDYQ